MRAFTLLPLIFCFTTTCFYGQTPSSGNQSIKQEDLEGVWSVDSTVFFIESKKRDSDTPIIPTVWEFTKNQKYGVYQNSSTIASGDYRIKDNALSITAMGMDTEYSVLKLSEQSMTLKFEIASISSSTIYFSRIE